ncbi:hypothetical protein [[Mycoplasma] anseris]|uniref:hypothetical protein n=1 Tax=[Mycoplasma] anseris TaxID=92400 RepID=UPI0011AB66A6|nr:hypothetical protein [[Mycoplasma] anseris]
MKKNISFLILLVLSSIFSIILLSLFNILNLFAINQNLVTFLIILILAPSTLTFCYYFLYSLEYKANDKTKLLKSIFIISTILLIISIGLIIIVIVFGNINTDIAKTHSTKKPLPINQVLPKVNKVILTLNLALSLNIILSIPATILISIHTVKKPKKS